MITRVSKGSVTLQLDVGEPLGWGYFGHIGRSLHVGDFGGPSFTWQLQDLGNDTYVVQNNVEDNFGRSYLAMSPSEELQLTSRVEGERSNWIIENPP